MTEALNPNPGPETAPPTPEQEQNRYGEFGSAEAFQQWLNELAAEGIDVDEWLNVPEAQGGSSEEPAAPEATAEQHETVEDRQRPRKIGKRVATTAALLLAVGGIMAGAGMVTSNFSNDQAYAGGDKPAATETIGVAQTEGVDGAAVAAAEADDENPESQEAKQWVDRYDYEADPYHEDGKETKHSFFAGVKTEGNEARFQDKLDKATRSSHLIVALGMASGYDGIPADIDTQRELNKYVSSIQDSPEAYAAIANGTANFLDETTDYIIPIDMSGMRYSSIYEWQNDQGRLNVNMDSSVRGKEAKTAQILMDASGDNVLAHALTEFFGYDVDLDQLDWDADGWAVIGGEKVTVVWDDNCGNIELLKAPLDHDTGKDDSETKTGTEGTGSEGTGSEDTGSEGTGSEGTGSEGTGSEGTGTEGDTPKSGNIEDYQRPGTDGTQDSGVGEKPQVAVTEDEEATPPAAVDTGTPEQQSQEPASEVSTPAAVTTTEILPTGGGEAEVEQPVNNNTTEAQQNNTQEVAVPQ